MIFTAESKKKINMGIEIIIPTINKTLNITDFAISYSPK